MTIKSARAAVTVAVLCCSALAIGASPAQAGGSPDPEAKFILTSRGTAQRFFAVPEQESPLRRCNVVGALRPWIGEPNRRRDQG